MDVKFLTYNLDASLNDYKEELLFLNVDYYSNHLKFRHLKMKGEKILGVDIESVELSFYGSKMGGIWLISNENDLLKLVKTFQDYYKEKPIRITTREHFHSVVAIEYYWINNVYLVGIGMNPYLGKAFIYVSLKHNNVYTLSES